MADDSELDYLRTFIAYACEDSTVKHYSEVRKIDTINATRRILVFPGEIISVDGKFYTKRYRIQLSEPSEANLMNTFNSLLDSIDKLARGQIGGALGYTGTHFDVNSEETDIYGIEWDGTNFWIIGNQNDETNKYTSAGVFASVTVSYNAVETLAPDVAFDGTYFWITGSIQEKLHKFDSSWSYIESFDISTEVGSAGTGLLYDGQFLWVYRGSNNIVYKYTTAGVYTGETITTLNTGGGATAVWGMDFAGGKIYTIDVNTEFIYQYDSDGVYTGISIDASTETTLPRGICIANKFAWVTDGATDEVYQYSFYSKPSVLVYITLKYGNKAFENGKTKRWYQDIYLDVEWYIS